MKNIGALAMLMPVAFQLAKRTDTSPSYLLMPMAFGSLLGGTMTLIGTSPNVIVSRMREDLVGEPFRMFDFTPVGRRSRSLGVAFLAFGYRLLPSDRKGAASLDAAFNIKGYTTEANVPEEFAAGRQDGRRSRSSSARARSRCSTIIRERFRRYTPSPTWMLDAGDVLLLEGEPAALERVVAQGKLKLAGGEDDGRAGDRDADDFGVMEAVVTGRLAARRPDAPRRHGSPSATRSRLLAVSRRGERLTQRLRTIKFQRRRRDRAAGRSDATCRKRSASSRCLPLAGRDIRLGRGRRRYVPIVVLAAAMALVALQVVPVAFGFFCAALVLILVALGQPARGLRGDRVAAACPDRRADPGQRGDAGDRRDRPHRRLALGGRRPRCRRYGALALILVAAHGGDAVPQQRRDRAGHGADRRRVRRPASATVPTRS